MHGVIEKLSKEEAWAKATSEDDTQEILLEDKNHAAYFSDMPKGHNDPKLLVRVHVVNMMCFKERSNILLSDLIWNGMLIMKLESMSFIL